jgi:hypothetical protein
MLRPHTWFCRTFYEVSNGLFLLVKALNIKSRYCRAIYLKRFKFLALSLINQPGRRTTEISMDLEGRGSRCNHVDPDLGKRYFLRT